MVRALRILWGNVHGMGASFEMEGTCSTPVLLTNNFNNLLWKLELFENFWDLVGIKCDNNIKINLYKYRVRMRTGFNWLWIIFNDGLLLMWQYTITFHKNGKFVYQLRNKNFSRKRSFVRGWGEWGPQENTRLNTVLDFQFTLALSLQCICLHGAASFFRCRQFLS